MRPFETSPQMAWIALVVAGSSALACQGEGEGRAQKSEPPASPAPRADSAEGVPRGTPPPHCGSDASSLGLGFPLEIAGYCVDAGVDVRRYGLDSPLSLDSICSQPLPGACDEEKAFGLDRLQTFRFVRTSGARVELSVRVSEFGRPRSAFGYFSSKAFGENTGAPFVAVQGVVGRAVRSGDVAYVWSGRRVVELRASSSTETAERVRAVAELDWPSFLAELRLPGADALPWEVSLLEAPELVGPTVRVLDDELLELTGSGPGAVGNYVTEAGGFRRLVAVRREDATAKDLLALLGREFSGKWLRNKTVLKARRARSTYSPETWYFARQGRVVVGVGPVRGTSASPEQRGDASVLYLRRLDALAAEVRRTPPPESG